MMGRDGLDEAAARARIASQAPLDEKLRVADVVIRNDARFDALVARSDEALDAVRVFVENAR
jgi:dephospho-CoA kinase